MPENHNNIVESDRILYTPSNFAKASLLHIQEIGILQAYKTHMSKREKLNSYLFITVNSGAGTLHYNGIDYPVHSGECIFIDCHNPYYHYTSENLWNISWIHFYGPTIDLIYNKYIERGGRPVFRSDDFSKYSQIWQQIFTLSKSNDNIRDIKINEGLSSLLILLMKDSWNPENSIGSNKNNVLDRLRKYLDENYTKKITLDDLAESYYINKFYLTRIFKKQYGISISTYITNIRITNAKHSLRFSNKSIEQIGVENGYKELYYFSRIFKQVEGVSPQEYRKRWK